MDLQCKLKLLCLPTALACSSHSHPHSCEFTFQPVGQASVVLESDWCTDRGYRRRDFFPPLLFQPQKSRMSMQA